VGDIKNMSQEGGRRAFVVLLFLLVEKRMGWQGMNNHLAQ
jgi:hypothetical protein